MKKKYSVSGIFALACLGGALCHASSIEYVSNSDGSFGVLDLQTGVFTDIATGAPAFNGMADIGGTLYGDDGTHLYTIDPANGATSVVGLTSTGYSFAGGQLGSSLYMFGFISGGPSDVYLASDNLSVGGGIVAGATFSYAGCGGFDAGLAGAGTTLYADIDLIGCSGGLPTSSNALYILDKSTGIPAEVGLTGLPVGELANLFSNSGVLYASINSGGNYAIYTIDTSSGIATLDTAITTNVYSGAEEIATTPEPGNAGLALLGVAFSLAYYRRKRIAALFIVWDWEDQNPRL